MLIENFRIELPSYVPIVVTLIIIGTAFYMSRKALKTTKPKTPIKPAANP
jgi:hypothetical protein